MEQCNEQVSGFGVKPEKTPSKKKVGQGEKTRSKSSRVFGKLHRLETINKKKKYSGKGNRKVLHLLQGLFPHNDQREQSSNPGKRI